MPAIKAHPDFPFIQIGMVKDLAPDDGPDPIFSPDDWMLKVVEVEDGGEPVLSNVFRSEEKASAGAEAWLFAPNRVWLVEHHLERAWKESNRDLVVKLAEGRGRAEERSRADGERAILKARVLAALG